MEFSKSARLAGFRTPLLTALTAAFLAWPLAPAALQAAGETGQAPANHEVLERTSAAFNQVAQKATPAVVSISAVKTATETSPAGLPFGMGPEGFDDEEGMAPPHGLAPDPFGGEPGGPSLGMGSGVVIRPDGLILTNNHVVEGADKVTVMINDKDKYKAKVLGSDPKTDIAVIQIVEPKVNGLSTIGFGNSDDVKVGDWAVAIGNPFGLSHSVTSGIISAKGRGQMGVVDVEDFIQTDAAINPGNSGGPLLNLDGQMIGLNAAIFSQSGGFIGIGFSIPSNLTRQIVDELVKHGRVKRGWIGVTAQDMEPTLAKYFKAKANKGAIVSEVTPGGPASQGELKSGDVIVQYNNQSIESSNDLKKLVSATRSGSRVPVEILREGKKKDIVVTVREQPQPRKPQIQQAGRAAGENGKKSQPQLGLAIQDIPPEFRQLLGIKGEQGALIVGVQPGSSAFEAGLSPGDVILKANGKSVRNAKDFSSLAKKFDKKDPAVLYIQRGGEGKIFVPVEMQQG